MGHACRRNAGCKATRGGSLMGRRAWLVGAGCVCAASMLPGCVSHTPLRVGFLGGMSGRIADLGIGGRNGTQLAVEEINAQGGLRGRLIELLPRDDEQDAEVARQRFGELLDAGIACLIGPMTSQMAAAILPMAEQRAVPVISPLAGANDLSGRQDVFFRVVSDAATSARQQGRALYRRGLRRLLPVNDVGNAIFTRGWNSALAVQFVASGGSALPPLEYVSGPGVRFIDLAQRIATSDADGASIAASAADCALLVQQLRRLRPGYPAGLSAWAGTEDLPRLAGTALDGVLVTQFFDRFSTSARWLRFHEQYRQRFGDDPGYPALNGYDAMQLAASALASTTHASVLAALRAVREFEGLQRRLTFDEYGDCLAPPYLTELRSGRYVAVPS